MIKKDFSGNFMQYETEPEPAPPWLVAVLGAGVDPMPLAPDPDTLARAQLDGVARDAALTLARGAVGGS